MFVTLSRLMLMACLLIPSLSWGLGLGEIHLNSALNEPMNAEIDLIAAGPEELARFAGKPCAQRCLHSLWHRSAAFSVDVDLQSRKSKDGRDVLLVRSTDSIPEPFVTFLVEVNWARGRLMREYTVLLDPPVYTPGERASSAAPVAAATTAPTAPTPAPTPRVKTSPLPSSPAPTEATATPETAPAAATPKRAGHAGRSAKRAASTSTAASAAAPSPTPESTSSAQQRGDPQLPPPREAHIVSLRVIR